MASERDVLSAIDAIRSRRSVRAFLPIDVPIEDVVRLLELSSRAPSGTNIQPWRAFVVRRNVIKDIARRILEEGLSPERAEWDDYKYYPQSLAEPFIGRRRALGEQLYGSLGIARRDIARRRAQFLRNFDFFGAPIGIFFTLDRQLETGSYIDLGMMMQTFMIAARTAGLHTCPQAAFAPFHKIIRPIVGIPEDQVLVCAVALGLEDPIDPSNGFVTDRIPVMEWVRIIQSSSTGKVENDRKLDDVGGLKK